MSSFSLRHSTSGLIGMARIGLGQRSGVEWRSRAQRRGVGPVGVEVTEDDETENDNPRLVIDRLGTPLDPHVFKVYSSLSGTSVWRSSGNVFVLPPKLDEEVMRLPHATTPIRRSAST
jgi:hypothetical protein